MADKGKTLKEIEKFSKESKLNKVEVVEKNTLPTLQTLKSELLPDNLETKKELSELRKFLHTALKHVETNEKNVLPTKNVIEEEKINSMSLVKDFDKSVLKPTSVDEKNPLPTANVLREEIMPDVLPSKPEISALREFVSSYLKKVDNVKESLSLPTAEDIFQEVAFTRAEVKTFDASKLKSVEVQEKNTLPTVQTLFEELLPDQLPPRECLSALRSFVDRTKSLKPVTTEVKNPLPTAETIELEKSDPTHEIKLFRKDSLKHVETAEKNSLPSPGDLAAELLPDYLPSRSELTALLGLFRSHLKHVVQQEKNTLPTAEDIENEKLNTRAEVTTFDKSKLKKA